VFEMRTSRGNRAAAPVGLPDADGAAYNSRMAAGRLNDPIEPMTLGNMRANGVRSLDVCCWVCHHRAIMGADPWSEDVPVPTFGPRMVCTRCGIVGADARPNWQEQPPRQSLTGVQWL
jgi:hypothetical protein